MDCKKHEKYSREGGDGKEGTENPTVYKITTTFSVEHKSWSTEKT